MRAAVYLRISEDRSAEGLGVQRQREDARRLVEQRGWTVAHEYVDNDRSAAKFTAKRPEFDAMVRSCDAGEIDAIVAWSHDRLTRNRRDELRLIETCQPRSVIIALVRGSDIDLTTPAGRMTADILASVARHEVEQKGDRTRRANEQAAKAGKPPGGPKSFGYERDGMTINEAEAEAVRQGYRSILRGSTLTSVARAWNEAGLYSGRVGWKTGKQQPWSNISLRRLLLNPRNAGLRRYKGEIIGEAQWPAIVDEETFRSVEYILTRPERLSASGRSDRRLLSGLALCGTCGATVLAGGATRANHSYPTYRCSQRGQGRIHVNRRADAVENHVNDVVVEFLSRQDVANSLFAPAEEDNAPLVDEANTLRARLDDLATQFADGVISSQQLRAGTGRLRERLGVVEQKLATVSASPAVQDLVQAKDVRARWEGLGIEQRRGVIETLLEVTLHPCGRGARHFDPNSIETRWRLG